ncbi:Wzz/FepE/Etk N-terminal domain-containing protein [Mucilaginibacter sp. 44-25]|uniref:Wzz/FepE/Etk N-terminal domain-containing protein n=1 Tax=Mucilaginibacter sp. 44-25 TaxID=1895794 RepID=UPI000966B5CE|nr:Wzz/FepE/Etk N-terminal domain-containing protein [Mucilaginibacter sp. 44-25]OJW16921.1 MAG: hypothetical protein BGO48_10760 [Mucilaginibacter sp. 44-25]
MTGQTQQNSTDRISLKDLKVKFIALKKYLFSKWVSIIAISIVGLFIGVAYAIVKKTTYKAITTFVLENNGNGNALSQYAGIASMMGIDIGGGKSGLFQVDNIVELYQSDFMIRKTLLSPTTGGDKNGLLVDRFISFNNLKDKWKNKPDLQNISFSIDTTRNKRTRDSLLSDFTEDIRKHYLTVGKLNDNSNIIKVEVNAVDELFAKEFADKIVSNVNRFYIQTKVKASAENLKILQHQTDSVRNVLNGAIYQAAAITDATPNLNPTRQILRAPVQRSQVNAEANKQMYSELVKNLELAKITTRKETPLIQVVDSPIYPLPKKDIKIPVGGIVGFIIAFVVAILFFSLKKSLDEL